MLMIPLAQAVASGLVIIALHPPSWRGRRSAATAPPRISGADGSGRVALVGLAPAVQPSIDGVIVNQARLREETMHAALHALMGKLRLPPLPSTWALGAPPLPGPTRGF